MGNAALEYFQADELLKPLKEIAKSSLKKEVKDGILNKILKVVGESGKSVLKETAQEVAQEGVTIAGTNIASKLEGKQPYSAKEITKIV